jgi:predicted O-methyltransferase YrrM
MPTDRARLAAIDAYIERLFVPPDAALSANLRRAETAGLPPIQVSPSEGKLLWLLTRMCGARRALEIGTLGGYSTTWLARGLAPGGTIVTLELSDAHAAVARASLAAVNLDVTVDVRVGPAAAQLAAMAAAGEPPFDVVFIDADKPGYEAYLGLVMPLVRVGSLILADNVIRDGAVLDDLPSDDNARGAAAFNRAVATHPRLEAIVVPIVRQVVDGLAIALVVR